VARHEPSSILDDPSTVARLDREDMLGHLLGLPRQVAEAWRLGTSVSLPANYANVSSIVTFGMGGSAIGADLARTVLEPELRIPMLTVRDYTCPVFVGPQTLVIAASYSGETEETLSALGQALQQGAKCIVITTGGTIAKLAARAGIPTIAFAYPSQPRAAVGYSAMLPLAVLHSLGLAHDLGSDVRVTTELMRSMAAELSPDRPTATNEAKQVAVHLDGRVAVIYAGTLAEVARRWKGQLNENAKHWAFFEALPEMNHNAVVPFEDPAHLNAGLAAVTLRSDLDHPRTELRFGAVGELLDTYGITWRHVSARGESRLAQVLSAVYLGDFASYYVALLNQTDPTPIGPITALKLRLSASPR
jgi:glucose/mannose-6-phosphate isomerase